MALSKRDNPMYDLHIGDVKIKFAYLISIGTNEAKCYAEIQRHTVITEEDFPKLNLY